ncbi:hypothetical protein GY45DRAFT_1341589 [Cubamyces sp. BRFM 1775]|nr:hypothetical protein GY45DRAFT_1341589 [Cubamyces sp. BRFM 1775]
MFPRLMLAALLCAYLVALTQAVALPTSGPQAVGPVPHWIASGPPRVSVSYGTVRSPRLRGAGRARYACIRRPLMSLSANEDIDIAHRSSAGHSHMRDSCSELPGEGAGFAIGRR